MKYFLTSNGFLNQEIQTEFEKLIQAIKNKTISIITTATDEIDYKEDSTETVVTEELDITKIPIYTYFSELGYTIHRVDLKNGFDTIQKLLLESSIIYVLGGDVNHLLDWAKKSTFKNILEQMPNDTLYVGYSAGSQIIGQDIGLTWWEPDDQDDHTGLGIVDTVICVHQSEDDPQKSIAALQKRKEFLEEHIPFPWPIYLLQDGQALLYDGKIIKHIGPGDKKII